MKLIFLYLLLFSLDAICFVDSQINGTFGWFNWFTSFYLVLFMFWYASEWKEKLYCWLCVYRFGRGDNQGNGRTFVWSAEKKLSKNLVEVAEDYISNKNNFNKCFITNMQRMEK